MASVDRVKAAGAKLLTATGGRSRTTTGGCTGSGRRSRCKGGHSYWRETDTRQEVAWVSGAAMLVERAAFLALGGFDEKLFLYKEDEDLCLRLREAGWQVVYEPAAAVRHLGSVVADQHRELARGVELLLRQALRGPAIAPRVRGRAPVAGLPALVTLAPEPVGRPIAELERAEQRSGDPGMGGEREQRPVDVWRELAAGPDEPHRVLAERALASAAPARRERARGRAGASAVAS